MLVAGSRLIVAILLLLTSIALPIVEVHAATMSALGSCYLSPSGTSVTFGGKTESSKTEDTIQVTVKLWEKRDGTWYEISSVSKSKTNAIRVTASKTVTVSGGHYYKVTATHFSQTGTVTSTSSSSTSPRWIP